jgi:cytochrome c-type biogenesis protein
VTTGALAFLAGMLTMLSPCVLPVIPLVMGGAARAVRFGPLILLLGMIASFSITGSFLTALLFQLDLSPRHLTSLTAVILIVVGLFLLVDRLDNIFKSLSSSFAQRVDQSLLKLSVPGAVGQFLIGAAIGIIWAPCTGPTLGAAIALAAQGENLLQVFATMLAFSVGASLPLGLLGYATKTFASRRQSLMKFALGARRIMALLFIAIGFFLVSGAHRSLETWILMQLPEWWVNLITSL